MVSLRCTVVAVQCAMPRTMKHEPRSISMHHTDPDNFCRTEGAATSSLFTESYGATMDHGRATLSSAAIGGSSETLPFWMTLPDPVPTVNVDGSDRIEVSSECTHSLAH